MAQTFYFRSLEGSQKIFLLSSLDSNKLLLAIICNLLLIICFSTVITSVPLLERFRITLKVGAHYATSCSNILQWPVAATNPSVCSGEFLWKSLTPQQNFVGATCHKKSNQTELVQLVAARKFICRDKDFHKNSPGLTKQFVAVMCCCN